MLDLMAEQRVAAEQHAAEAEARLRHMRQKLREVSGRTDVTPSTLMNSMASMDESRQKIEMELLAKSARRAALESEIARTAEKIEKQSKSDAIAAELEKVVEAREAQVARIKELVAQNAASQAEMQEAIGRVAEARAKLLQQQRDAAAAAGGAALEAFNRELMSLSIDCKELEAKLAYLSDRLPKLREVVDQIDELQRAEREADHARALVMKQTDELRATQMRMLGTGDGPPQVMLKESRNEMTREEAH
jgi:chromosome segregation ATPase